MSFAIAYGVARGAYDNFYDVFGISPEDVGLTQTRIVASSAGLLLVYGAFFSSAIVMMLVPYRLSRGLLRFTSRDAPDALAPYMVATGWVLILYPVPLFVVTAGSGPVWASVISGAVGLIAMRIGTPQLRVSRGRMAAVIVAGSVLIAVPYVVVQSVDMLLDVRAPVALITIVVAVCGSWAIAWTSAPQGWMFARRILPTALFVYALLLAVATMAAIGAPPLVQYLLANWVTLVWIGTVFAILAPMVRTDVVGIVALLAPHQAVRVRGVLVVSLLILTAAVAAISLWHSSNDAAHRALTSGASLENSFVRDLLRIPFTEVDVFPLGDDEFKVCEDQSEEGIPRYREGSAILIGTNGAFIYLLVRPPNREAGRVYAVNAASYGVASEVHAGKVCDPVTRIAE